MLFDSNFLGGVLILWPHHVCSSHSAYLTCCFTSPVILNEQCAHVTTLFRPRNNLPSATTCCTLKWSTWKRKLQTHESQCHRWQQCRRSLPRKQRHFSCCHVNRCALERDKRSAFVDDCTCEGLQRLFHSYLTVSIS